MGRATLVDCHGVIHPLRYVARKNMMYGQENDNFIIVSFLNYLSKWTLHFGTNQFVFAWDSSTSIRKQFHSWYKNRPPSKGTEQELACDAHSMWQLEKIRDDILPKIGFRHNHRYEGYEADDIIAAAVMNNTGAYTIVSKDEDFYQLLPYANIWQMNTMKSTITERAFQSKYKLSPHDWWKVKAYAGCRSDTVPGIPGVGEKTAIRYLTQTLSTETKAYSRIVSEAGQQIFERNSWLVRLPLHDCPIPDLDIGDEALSREGFEEVVDTYSLAPIMMEEDRILFIQRMRLR